MRKLDFLSNFPKAYIFQQSSNKTTFGGFLTIIYVFIVLLIAFTYVYNYYVNDKYIISYITYQSKVTDEKREELLKDDEYNPSLNFSFEILDQNYQPLSENFLLVDMRKCIILDRNKLYSYKVSDLVVAVVYNCSDTNCDLRPEDKWYEYHLYYNFKLKKQIFSLNLQDKNQPIQLNNNYLEQIFVMNQNFMQSVNAYWEIIKVTEEKGLFDNYIGSKKEKIGGSFSDSNDFFNIKSISMDTQDYPCFHFPGIYKPIFNFQLLNQFDKYIEYRRKKISIFDIIANICSLSLTIFNGFRFGFAFFYSQKFDNYKIIDKILTSKGRAREKKINDTKFDKSFPLLNENEMKEEDEKDVDKINLITETESEKNEDSLPKYHFFNFICNFFSCKCCQKNKVQKSITICNNIMEKYYSIENLIYSQFMLENLLQDYKWNNPDLNSIKNIELIYKLNQIIKTEGMLQ